MESKLHARMRKILALAERGERGERETAQRMLKKMMDKYSITLEALESDTLIRCWWNFDDKYERRLIIQIAAKVMNTSQIEYYKGDRKLGFELTRAQQVEFEMLYSVLKRDLRAHIDRAITAFIHANGIFSEASSRDEREYTAEEIAEAERMLRMAGTIKPSEVHRQLNLRNGTGL